ncbi:CAP-Gly domain-containing linker protein 1-like [Dendronephthya gigantea]|uniref:CAP-Gly domain-containing linker protein 1-like n=1 Tax=Dendronephthya gigantea TaxID=151771 RepID=UPI00106DB73C|nr:CAP-Gly domain-containing linker protein 1-like [Dendronephthya gigantea]
MDPNVQTKTPKNRRAKFIIIGLIVVICILSFQLYRINKIKKQLVIRKSFLINKLYECRVSSEKMEGKFKEKRAQNEQLKKTIATKQEAYEEMSAKYNELETSLNKKTEELTTLKKKADDSKKDLSNIQQEYDSAMSSIKSMQGQLDETIKVCDKHKEATRSLNESTAQIMHKLEVCNQDMANLQRDRTEMQQKRAGLERNQQALQSEIEQMRKSASAADQTRRSLVQKPLQQTSVVKTTPSAYKRQSTKSPVNNDSKSSQNEEGASTSQLTNKSSASAPRAIVPTQSRNKRKSGQLS